MRRVALGVLLAAFFAQAAHAQQKSLTLDDIFGQGGSARFSGKSTASLGFIDDPWIDEAHYLWPSDDGSQWLRVDALSGKSEPLFDPEKLARALSQVPGVVSDDAKLASRRRPTNFNARHDGFLLTIADDLYYYDISGDTATRLTQSRGAKEEATFSPDGKSVAFISNNNLFVTSVRAPAARALTTDGSEDLLNAKLDWVYSEELYGRGKHRAYWWSPDSSRLAFLQLDEKAVPKFTVVDDMPYHPTVETWHYPKAGDPNPVPKLGIVSAGGGSIRWVDTTKYNDFLIVDVGWTPDSRSVAYQVQDRRQSWLDFDRADRAGGSAGTLFQELSKTWVERWEDESADPIWLKDGSFLWLSERSGWRHLYHYRSNGSLSTQLTDGEWEVRSVLGIDETSGWIYFSATERSVLGSDLYRVKLDGSGLQRISFV